MPIKTSEESSRHAPLAHLEPQPQPMPKLPAPPHLRCLVAQRGLDGFVHDGLRTRQVQGAGHGHVQAAPLRAKQGKRHKR